MPRKFYVPTGRPIGRPKKITDAYLAPIVLDNQERAKRHYRRRSKKAYANYIPRSHGIEYLYYFSQAVISFQGQTNKGTKEVHLTARHWWLLCAIKCLVISQGREHFTPKELKDFVNTTGGTILSILSVVHLCEELTTHQYINPLGYPTARSLCLTMKARAFFRDCAKRAQQVFGINPQETSDKDKNIL